MIDHINRTRPCHIITIEDPVEYLHRDDLAAIDQREVGFDTDSFTSAMRVVLRQDPDVILVGEMRDPETVYTALTAAETGHLVFSTLHTTNATETVNRIVDFFPPHQQGQIRVSLAAALRGTICQRLVPRADGQGRVPALEVMVVNGRIQQAILDPLQTSDIDQIMLEGEYYGMQTFDQSLAELLQSGQVDAARGHERGDQPARPQGHARAHGHRPDRPRVRRGRRVLTADGPGAGTPTRRCRRRRAARAAAAERHRRAERRQRPGSPTHAGAAARRPSVAGRRQAGRRSHAHDGASPRPRPPPPGTPTPSHPSSTAERDQGAQRRRAPAARLAGSGRLPTPGHHGDRRGPRAGQRAPGGAAQRPERAAGHDEEPQPDARRR